MAKNNPYWGKQKGKLGETVLAVVKGQQVQRAYNAEPLNPKTKKQTDQRMIFASAVKFFKSAIDQQFKFAYEDRKQQESDYNAFMRHNIGISLPTTKEALDQANFVPFGPYVVSNGSIPEIAPKSQGGTFIYYDYGVDMAQNPTTLQQSANQLKLSKGLLDGDIITILRIDTRLKSYKGTPDSSPSWTVLQIKVGDTSDNRTWATVSAATKISADKQGFSITTTFDVATMGGLIISRPTDKGLKVSTCTLCMNNGALEEYNKARGLVAKKESAMTWGVRQDAVLEGSLLPQE